MGLGPGHGKQSVLSAHDPFSKSEVELRRCALGLWAGAETGLRRGVGRVAA